MINFKHIKCSLHKLAQDFFLRVDHSLVVLIVFLVFSSASAFSTLLGLTLFVLSWGMYLLVLSAKDQAFKNNDLDALKTLFADISCPESLAKLLVLFSMIVLSSNLVLVIFFILAIIPLYVFKISANELNIKKEHDFFKNIKTDQNKTNAWLNIIPSGFNVKAWFKASSFTSLAYMLKNHMYSIGLSFVIMVLQIICS